MQKGFGLVIVIVGVLIALGAIGGAFYIGKKTALKSEDISRTTPPELTAKSPKLNTSSMPVETGIPDETANWKTYTNEKYKYTVKYPQDWNAEDDVNYDDPNKPKYSFFYKEKKEFAPGISISLVLVTTPEEWIGADSVKNYAKIENIMLNGLDVTRVTGIPGALEQEWIFINNKGQTVIFHTSEESNEIEVLDNMITTFKFLE